MNYRILIFFIFIFISAVPLVNKTWAAYDNTHISIREKGVFAFFKLAGTPPDFEHMIKDTQKYKSLPDADKEEYFINESIRLGTGYGRFDLEKDLLHIETIVSIRYTNPTEDKPAHFSFQFPNHNKDYIPTFSYPYAKKEWISLIINKLALFSDFPLKEKDYELISKHLTSPDYSYDAMLTIDVKPAKADYSSPIKIGNIKQWIMIGEIAYMKCEVESEKTGTMQQLWYYVAPWYKEEYERMMMPEDMKYPHPYDLKK